MSLVSSLTRTRAATCSIMLVSAGCLPWPPRRIRRATQQPAKRSSPLVPLATRTSRAKTNSDRYWLVCSTGFRGAEGSSGGPIAVRT
jgi:hypothetical protein